MMFSYNIPGKELYTADTLSRAPVAEVSAIDQWRTLHEILGGLVPKAREF